MSSDRKIVKSVITQQHSYSKLILYCTTLGTSRKNSSGMSFGGRFLASVYLRGGSRNLSQPTPVQHPCRFCLLFFKKHSRPSSSLLLPGFGIPPVKDALFGAHCMCWQCCHFPGCQELITHQEGLS